MNELQDASAHIGQQKWINYPRARTILGELERLYAAPARPRMPGRLIVGEGSNGKTWLLKHFVNMHPEHEALDAGSRTIPVAFVNAPPNPNQSEFYERILVALGNAPCPPRSKPGERLQQIRKLKQTLDLRLLIIDEVHTILAGPRNIQRIMANVIKDLSNELEVSIVLAGTHLAHNALQIDVQLSTRFPTLELPNWRFDDDFRRLLLSLQQVWKIEFDIEDLGPRILALSTPRHRSEFGATIGVISELVESAALHAAKRGAATLKKLDVDNCVIGKQHR